MATIDLQVTSVVTNSGFTNVSVETLNTSNDVRAQNGVAGDFLVVEIEDVPGDFGSQNTIQIHVEARHIGTIVRTKQITFDLLDNANNVLDTAGTGDITATEQVFSTVALSRSDAAATINGYRIRPTVTEGGGMPDSATIEIDHMFATLDYELAALQLVVADAAHGHTADGPVLTQAHMLAANDAAHAQLAENVALSQAHLLEVQQASHDHVADSLLLSFAVTLNADDASHGHAADSLALSQAQQLGVNDAVHGHSAESVVLSTKALLQVAAALHAHDVDNVVLSQASILSVAEALHAHAATSIVLQQGAALEVDSVAHAQSADAVALTAADVLAVASSIHLHLADEIELTQDHVLVVSNALHQQLAAMPALQLPGADMSAWGLFVLETEDRIYVIAPADRVFRI
jgi:hypothetical protein